MAFSERLKAARERAGLTQQQVADQLGIVKSTYCGYETGKRQPDPARLQAIARVLDTPADVLLETELHTPTQEDLQAAFWGGDQDLPPETLDALWEDVQAYARFKAAEARRKQKGDEGHRKPD